MPNNRIGYQHINIVNIVPSAAMHTPLSIWFQPRRFEGKPGTSVYLVSRVIAARDESCTGPMDNRPFILSVAGSAEPKAKGR